MSCTHPIDTSFPRWRESRREKRDPGRTLDSRFRGNDEKWVADRLGTGPLLTGLKTLTLSATRDGSPFGGLRLSIHIPRVAQRRFDVAHRRCYTLGYIPSSASRNLRPSTASAAPNSLHKVRQLRCVEVALLEEDVGGVKKCFPQRHGQLMVFVRSGTADVSN